MTLFESRNWTQKKTSVIETKPVSAGDWSLRLAVTRFVDRGGAAHYVAQLGVGKGSQVSDYFDISRKEALQGELLKRAYDHLQSIGVPDGQKMLDELIKRSNLQKLLNDTDTSSLKALASKY